MFPLPLAWQLWTVASSSGVGIPSNLFVAQAWIQLVGTGYYFVLVVVVVGIVVVELVWLAFELAVTVLELLVAFGPLGRRL